MTGNEHKVVEPQAILSSISGSSPSGSIRKTRAQTETESSDRDLGIIQGVRGVLQTQHHTLGEVRDIKLPNPTDSLPPFPKMALQVFSRIHRILAFVPLAAGTNQCK